MIITRWTACHELEAGVKEFNPEESVPE